VLRSRPSSYGWHKRMMKTAWLVCSALIILPALLFVVTACGSSEVGITAEYPEQAAKHESPVILDEGDKLNAVATTSIVGDVVKNVGGDMITVEVLMPLGADPHTFEPTPQDVASMFDADVLFANGAGLEVFLEPLLESAGAGAKIVYVSQGIELLSSEGDHEHEGEEGSGHEGVDPHTWTDPINVMVWVDNIKNVLKNLDPNNAEAYESNAEAYEKELEELDAWVRAQVARVPETSRQIVTDHRVFAYFADEYGFTQVGAIVPAYSTLAEPSAKELVELENAVKDFGVKAILVGNTVNPSLAQRVARDTGTKLVFIYTGSLTAPGGEADNYLDYIRYDVEAIVNALK
jgi:manganese/iron transport system substrate-binding protein